MSRRRITVQPSQLHDAAAFGYAHGVLTSDLLHVAGQVSRADTLEEQAEDAFGCFRAVVEAAGGTMADVVRLHVHTTAPDCWDRIAEARRRFVQPPYPAITLTVVAGLADPAFQIEIEGTAIIGSGG